MNVKIGVIAAAGSGTRMMPVTLGYPKELLPIINKPAIQLIIDEFIDSGLKKIIVVTGANPEPLRRQYDASGFPAKGKQPVVDEFARRLAGIELVFEKQVGNYGNGTPLMTVRPHLADGERFVYAYGDDLIKSKTPFARRLIEKHERTGAIVVGTQEVPHEDVVRYGIAQVKEGSTENELFDVVEKPSLEEAKSNLAMFGRFLLSTEIIDILSNLPLGKSGELWLTDAIREYIRRGGKAVAEPVADGKWLTIGDPLNYLKCVMEYALDDPELRAGLEPGIRELLG